MKKAVVMLLALTMILSSLMIVSAIPVSAVVEGDWEPVYDAGIDLNDQPYPLPGYSYNENGLTTISPDYTNYITRQSMMTKSSYNLKVENDINDHHVISLEFTADEFPYRGDTGEDEWISIAVWNQKAISHGMADCGIGYLTLIRGAGNGSASALNYLSYNGEFTRYSSDSITCETNEKGREMYSFCIDYDGKEWTVNINGIEMSYGTIGNDADINEVFDSFTDGAYISVTYFSGVVGAKASMSITKFNGEIPAGDDSAEPGKNEKVFAGIADASTVPENQPALLWDGTVRDCRNISGTNATFTVNSDNTVHIKPTADTVYVNFGIKSEVSYSAEDFPVVAVLVRNAPSEDGGCFYCAGEVMASKDEYSTMWYANDVRYTDGWGLSFIDLNKCWSGRIHSLRIDFHNIDMSTENQFDIGFIAVFRNTGEAQTYAENILTAIYGEGKIKAEEPTAAEVTTVAEVTTGREQATEGKTIEEPRSTEAELSTTAYTESNTEKAKSDKGCGGVIVLAPIALTLPIAICFKKRKK